MDNENKAVMEDWLEGEEFYNLMQAYRTTPVDAYKEFEAVKDFIRSNKINN